MILCVSLPAQKTLPMYEKLNLSQLIALSPSSKPKPTWNNQIACLPLQKDDVTQHTGFRDMPLYMFTLVLKGSIQLRHQGDIKTYSENSIITEVPTMTPTEVITASEDFEAFCLMIDQNLLSQAPFINYMIRAIYFPVAELGQTGMSLSATDAHFLLRILQMINQHIDFTSDFQREALFALCQVFCIDLLHIQGKHIAQRKVKSRVEALFTQFVALVTRHFAQQHSLVLYAEKLSITTTYLSRIVKQVSGRTAMSFIQHALLAQAVHQLKNTDISMNQLAEDLHFSDPAAFTKFFTRMKGIPPKTFRKIERPQAPI
ncbi:AraC family transcriptional regulator [Ornithobacterium rhinotracheale]|uniref:AraC family transcriptional regulator n=1 Tax=Ornithobacterium rhinotracheale TaxID=28251 RepID=A0A3R6AVX6_ORNRH|nr:helix-turn-helix domain-containing protein [Ornithobacterium rhinotracheale]QAR31757.1 AraC family transcriptional regulator [Ornithobacterium rhinotracheale]